jgi:hypothetical protein
VSYLMGTWGSFLGGKAAGASESTASCAAVDNEWRYTPTPILIYGGRLVLLGQCNLGNWVGWERHTCIGWKKHAWIGWKRHKSIGW